MTAAHIAIKTQNQRFCPPDLVSGWRARAAWRVGTACPLHINSTIRSAATSRWWEAMFTLNVCQDASEAPVDHIYRASSRRRETWLVTE